MLRFASLSLALFGLFALVSMPVMAEEAAPHAAAPHAAAPAPAAAPVAAPAAHEEPKAEPVKTEEPKAEAAKPAPEKQVGEKQVGKMRDRWKKMTPEQRNEMRKKAEARLGERYERLKTSEQDTIKNIMAEISKLSKEERSILMAKIKQQASKERAQRKLMKEMENNKKEAPAKEAPAADPNAVKH